MPAAQQIVIHTGSIARDNDQSLTTVVMYADAIGPSMVMNVCWLQQVSVRHRSDCTFVSYQLHSLFVLPTQSCCWPASANLE